MPISGEIAKAKDIGKKDRHLYVWIICPDCRAGRWENTYDLKRAKHKGRCQSCSQPALKGG